MKQDTKHPTFNYIRKNYIIQITNVFTNLGAWSWNLKCIYNELFCDKVHGMPMTKHLNKPNLTSSPNVHFSYFVIVAMVSFSYLYFASKSICKTCPFWPIFCLNKPMRITIVAHVYFKLIRNSFKFPLNFFCNKSF